MKVGLLENNLQRLVRAFVPINGETIVLECLENNLARRSQTFLGGQVAVVEVDGFSICPILGNRQTTALPTEVPDDRNIVSKP